MDGEAQGDLDGVLHCLCGMAMRFRPDGRSARYRCQGNWCHRSVDAIAVEVHLWARLVALDPDRINADTPPHDRHAVIHNALATVRLTNLSLIRFRLRWRRTASPAT